MSVDARSFLESHRNAVLATIRRDGRPQLSNVLVASSGDTLLISTGETRAKYRNMVRDPRVTAVVMGDHFYQYLTIDGTATFTHLPEARIPLREYFELASGKPHPNWEEYDAAMVEEKRVLVSIHIDHMIGFGVEL